MDFGNLGNGCAEYIYSDKYINYLVRYDNDLQRVYDVFEPACVSVINVQFLIAHVRKESDDVSEFFRYGYESIPKCYGLMDTSVVEDIGATRLQNFPGLSLFGEGVLVGFVDTGIDYTSWTFRNEDGSSRIDYIWDQNEEVYGYGRSIYGFGAEFSKIDIDRALESENPYEVVPTRDDNGHGTFLASVAVGTKNQEGTFSGVATKASLAVVKLKKAKKSLRDFYLINEQGECYSEDDIILGVKYLVQTAEILGKPLVICLGVGSNQGGHNGNTYLESYLDIVSRFRGICIVTPTGNEVGYGTHFSSDYNVDMDADKNSENNVEILVGDNNPGFTMELWGKAPSLLRISILSPTGELFSGVSPLVSGSTRKRFIYEGTDLYVENIVVERISGNPFIFFRFTNPAEGIWTINVEEFSGVNKQGFNIWLPLHNFIEKETRFVRPNPNITITAPGNAKLPITVAGYNHLSDALYVNSGRGYTVNNQIKPELTAPAVNVYGTFATNVTAGFIPTGQTNSRDLFIRRSGTSVAAAVTAGAVALILEWAIVKKNNMNIETENIKQMLIRGARKVVDVNYPNSSWGYGALDIYGAFEAMRNV